MIVSWNWLKDYVEIDADLEKVTSRLTMSGLNLESVEHVSDDIALDLEVTSNRPDCLGHLGIARELAVLFDKQLTIPTAEVQTVEDKTADATSVKIECEDLCPQYVARVIRGVRVGPSPKWMQDRLATIGVTPINNIVDVTNYVLMECGQPLHAFDFDKLHGQRIIVRRASDQETIHAIDHREYQLTSDMCVIADAERPVAVGGVMGGADTEIHEQTANVLVEVANFSPTSIRSTARTIRTVAGTEKRTGLHSDSSYRFERGIDTQQLLWASNRCCELILETAGGELLDEPVIAGTIPEWNLDPITLRFAQIRRLLGIDIPKSEVMSILHNLGVQATDGESDTSASFLPPPWRRDLTREVDLIEEIARIHGYDEIPENISIPVLVSAPSKTEKTLDRVRNVLYAAGFHEAMTFSFTTSEQAELFDPVPEVELTRVEPAAGEYGNRLRKSLIPSLVSARRENERVGNLNAQLYEIARVFRHPDPSDIQTQPMMLGFVTGRSFRQIRGILDALVSAIGSSARMTAEPCELPGFLEGRGARVSLDGTPWGLFGEMDRSREPAHSLKLREPVLFAEVQLAPLLSNANLVPQAVEPPAFPAVIRDLNFLLDESVTWEALETCVQNSGGELVESVSFVEQYRGQHIPAGQKSYVMSISYRSPERTLRSEEVDASQSAIIDAVQAKLGATLR